MQIKRTYITVTLIMLTFISSLLAQDTDWANLNKYKAANAKLEAPSKKENRVVFMGNSITEKWLLRDSIFWQGKPYVNRGISGQVTSQMLLRFRDDVINHKPKVVVILAGTNDIAQNKGPISLEQIAGNVFSMVELAQANKIKVVICSVLPALQYKWRKKIKPAGQIIELNKLLKAYAEKNKITYVDYYTPMVDDNKGLKKEYSPDGVHPNNKGYLIMRPLVEKGIQNALRKRH